MSGYHSEPMATSPPSSLPRVVVYTDGGADPNPGPGGWGVVMDDVLAGVFSNLSLRLIIWVWGIL